MERQSGDTFRKLHPIQTPSSVLNAQTLSVITDEGNSVSGLGLAQVYGQVSAAGGGTGEDDSAGAGGRGSETMEGVPLSTGKLQLGITGEFLQSDGSETSTSIRESDRAAKARAGA